ncbi:MAG: hypothetical protein ACK57P_05805, partial [Planctomycetota bacterium]
MARRSAVVILPASQRRTLRASRNSWDPPRADFQQRFYHGLNHQPSSGVVDPPGRTLRPPLLMLDVR